MTDPAPVVYKFGGTSLSDASRIRRAADLTRRAVDLAPGAPDLTRGGAVVVVSALAGVTTQLEILAAGGDGEAEAHLAEIESRHRREARSLSEGGEAELEEAFQRLRALADRSSSSGAPPHALSEARPHGLSLAPLARRDALVATGEDLSARLIASALRSAGLAAEVADAREIVRTDSRFGRAVPDDETTVRLARERLTPLLERGVVPVVQGFIGADAEGRTTTLGRGGSDFTAAIVGAALEASEVTIWTDVDGIFTADPSAVPAARTLAEMGYEEAVELAYFGAKVLHPAAAKHAAARGVALRIRNSFRPDAPGTLVHPDRREAPGVAAIAYKPHTALLRVRSRPHFMASGFLARVFEILSRHDVPVDMIATSHTATAFTVDRAEELQSLERALREVAEVEAVAGLGTVSVVGRGLLGLPGITGEIFRVLGSTHVELISQATDTSLSFLVAEEECAPVVRRLHAVLLEGT